jgi:hypothetical protein
VPEPGQVARRTRTVTERHIELFTRLQMSVRPSRDVDGVAVEGSAQPR